MTTIKLKNGSGAPLAGDLVQGEPALDLTNKRLYTENSSGTVIEVGTNPTSLTTGTFTSTGIDDNAASTAITIDGSQNVGIGTSSPARSLHVVGTGRPAEFGSNNALNYVKLYNSATGSATYNGLDLLVNSTSNSQINAYGMPLTFGTSASNGTDVTERMRIDSSGNVGIGTSSIGSSTKLQVAGRGLFTDGLPDPADGSPAGVAIGYNTTSGYGFIQAIQTGVANKDLYVQPSGSNNVIIANSGGNVGIGNSSPLGRLTISNAAGTNAPTTVTAANTYLQLGSDDYGPSNNGKFMIGFGYTDAINTNSPAYMGYEEVSTSGDTYGDLTFYTRSVNTDTAPAERMRIDASGNVGIGESSPFDKLVVRSSDANSVQSALSLKNGDIGTSAGVALNFVVDDNNDVITSAIYGQRTASAYHQGSLQFLTRDSGGAGLTERMRLDSSGNLLVGTTSTSLPSTDAFVFLTNGEFRAGNDATSGGSNVELNRENSDGDFIRFYRAGSEVGSIASRGGNVTTIIFDPRSNGSGISGTTNGLLPTNQAGTPTNNHVDLGSDTNKFKDLYLSGGAYLGGTGSANKLDDYEEGTFTPTLNTSVGDLANFSYNTRTGAYTKVGNIVTVSIELSTHTAASVSGTGQIQIQGLPFIVADNTNGGRNCLALTHDNRWANNPQFGQSQSTTTSITLFKTNAMNTANAMTVSDMSATDSANFNIVTVMFTYRTS